MNRIDPWFRVACLAASVLPLPGQGAVAMVADLTGRANFSDGRSMGLTAEIPALQTLNVGKGSRLVLVNLKTGEQYFFTGPCKIRLDVQGRPDGTMPAETKKGPSLRGDLRFKSESFAQASMVMKEVDLGASSFERMVPQASTFLDPAFELYWSSGGNDAIYHFTLSDDKGQVLADLRLAEPILKLPEHVAFAEGGTYTWALETIQNGGDTKRDSGHFKLLPKEKREQLKQARPKEGAPFSDRLVFAMLLEQFELRDEARRQWKLLSEERPKDEVLKARAEK